LLLHMRRQKTKQMMQMQWWRVVVEMRLLVVG